MTITTNIVDRCLRGGLVLLVFAVGGGACGDDKPAPGPAIIPVDGAIPRPLDAGPATADAGADGAGAEGGSSAMRELGVTALSPGSGARGAAVTLQIRGTAFAEMAAVKFDGETVPTTRQSATQLTATIAPALTEQVGFHAVAVDNGPGGGRSPVVYYQVASAAGWPEVLDVNPDNGQVGDQVRIVGFNLSGEALRISDGGGHMAASARIGTIAGTNLLLETAEFTVPADWQSGPMLVANTQGAFRAKIFNVGRNLARLPGAKATASSEYGGEWTIARGADNDIFTSWFTAAGDCISRGAATCKMSPWFMITFPEPQTVGRIVLRGNREYTSGYDFLEGAFEILGPGDQVLWTQSRSLPEPDRDLDLTLGTPVPGATAVRFRSLKDESEDPGFGELEIFGP